MFSGLATTRAAAGGLDNQRKIDYDLNLELAKAAKEAGVETYVLISGAGSNSRSPFAYIKMKGELEDSILALKFKHTVFIKPGFISGDRTNREVGVAENVLKWVAKGMGGVHASLKNMWAQDGETIARAAVRVGEICVSGERKEEGVWEVEQGEIVRFGLEKK
jgi:uncharacterized protein YbjT (DUF2867 family)